MAAEQSPQKRLGNALFYGIAALLVYLAYLIVEPFLAPLAWAAVLVVFCYPAYKWLARRWGPTGAAAATTLAVIVVLIVPMLAVMAAFVRQGIDAAHAIQLGVANGHFARVNDWWMRLQEKFPDATPMDLPTLLQTYAGKAAGYIAGQLGTVLKHTAEFLFHLGVTIVAMFYLFRDGDSIVARLRDVLPFEAEHRDRMLDGARYDLRDRHVEFGVRRHARHVGRCGICDRGREGADFLGRDDGILFAGAGCGLRSGLGADLDQRDGYVAISDAELRWWFFAVWLSGLVDYVIRPWLISGRARIGGLLIFISVLGGIGAFGMLGIVLGPMILAMAASVFDVYVPIRTRWKQKSGCDWEERAPC